MRPMFLTHSSMSLLGLYGIIIIDVVLYSVTHADARSLRRHVDRLVRHDAAQDAAITTLTACVTRLEKNVGLTNARDESV
jgi:hypothetical protein